ncbi:hypothetical protein QE152_g26839 [Popillia japonica]|uniref:Uncharacterized protein n=1 Tax=Popillia japonica TaxID=7064 RepID=A0AAW1JWZ6_POPJA
MIIGTSHAISRLIPPFLIFSQTPLLDDANASSGDNTTKRNALSALTSDNIDTSAIGVLVEFVKRLINLVIGEVMIIHF